MKLYDKVKLKENIKNYNKGSIGIIVEIYNNTVYLEMLDSSEKYNWNVI